MNADIIVTQSGGGFNRRISIDGLSSLMRFLETSDPRMQKAIRDGLKEAASPILTRGRANGRAIADDGTYAESLSISVTSRGNIKFRSTDPAAGVKEFARVGATYVPSPADKRRNARKMRRFPVGVPRRANPPRVMIPAVEDSVEDVKTRIDLKLEEVLRRADG